ncbi:glycosyltransferase [Zhengella sp. ZM62]|uniref:glycosyltransferase n=1 Tax=Zhengella sedimenti TaxID=3390035 RepID=UPI0039754DE1
MTQVHIVQNLAPGGIEQLVLALAGMPGIHVFSLEGSVETLAATWPKAALAKARLTAFGKAPGLQPLLPVRMARHLRGMGATSVVTHHAGPLVYGGAAARLAGIRSLAHVEHDAWHLENRRRRLVMQAALRCVRPDRIAVSPVVAAAASKGTGLSFRVIPNGVDCDMFRPARRDAARARLGLPLDRRIVGGVGRLERVKGFDRLVEAARFLPDHVLVVIWGEGSERERLASRIEHLGLAHRVLLAGRTDSPADVYPALDLFCLPSRSEGLPLSILEAQACGIAVVASDVGGVRDGLCPVSGTAVTVDDRDPQWLATALIGGLANPPRANPRLFIQSHLSLAETRSAYRALEAHHA